MTHQGTRVLLTGGAGFIGSHVAEALLERGAHLVVADSLDDFYSPEWKRRNLEEVRQKGSFTFHEEDICKIDRMEELFRRTLPDVVIHLAARAGVRPSIEQPLLYERVNVAGTCNLLEMCRKFRVQRFIFGSSSSVYGATCSVPFSEDRVELRPISPYAATKLSAELISYTYARLFDLSVVCLRFFTVYGPRQRPDLAIHKFTSLIEAGKALPIFGDGSSGRDYTYIEDIVSGVLASLDYQPRDSTGAPFEIFNLGNSHPITLKDLVDELGKITGRKAILIHEPMPSGDVPITWANISKARRSLGYHPTTTFSNGLKQFVDWYRSRSSQLDVPPCRTMP